MRINQFAPPLNNPVERHFANAKFGMAQLTLRKDDLRLTWFPREKLIQLAKATAGEDTKAGIVLEDNGDKTLVTNLKEHERNGLNPEWTFPYLGNEYSFAKYLEKNFEFDSQA